MALVSRLVGLNILVVIVFATMLLGGKLGIYLDLPSIVMVVGVLVGGALMCFPVGQLFDAFGAVFHNASSPPVSEWQRQTRIAVFARLYQLAWGGGLVGALLGLIAMLSDLSDPASIGAGMAVALVAPAYGALLAEFVFNPLQQVVMNLRPATGDDDPPAQRLATPAPGPGSSALFKGVAIIAVIVAMFMVPLVSFSEIKREDAFAPEVEATYLRYLYGDAAPRSKGVSPRLQPTMDQREREVQAVYSRLNELMSEQSEAVIEDAAIAVLAVPRDDGIAPDTSHVWRERLIDQYVDAYYATLLR